MLKKETYRSLVITLIYIALIGAFKFLFHELWKDEWQAWLLATDTTTLGALFKMLPLEGHPPLWFLLLRFCHFPFAAFNSGIHEDILLQGFHLVLVGISVFIFIRYLHIPLLIKILLLLSYFFCFEYGIVNRGYVLVMILSFIAVHRIRNMEKTDFPTILTLVALCLSEVYGVFIVFGLLVYLFIKNNRSLRRIWPVLVASGIGFVLFLVCIISPDAGSDYTLYQFSDFHSVQLVKAFQSIMVNTLLPGLVPTVYKGLSIKGVVISTLLFALTLFVFRKHKAVLFAWLAFCLSMLLFSALFYLGSPRNWGILFLFLVCMLHLCDFKSVEYRKTIPLLILTGSIVVFQLIHNLRILYRDYNEPFSNAKEAGHFIADHIAKNTPVFAVNKFFCTPVSGYASRPLYSFPEGKPFTYFKWREKLFIPGTSNFIQMRRKFHTDELFVLSYKALDMRKYPGLKTVHYFDRPNIRGENYYLYRY